MEGGTCYYLLLFAALSGLLAETLKAICIGLDFV